jgi:hypothetical protein
MDTYFKQMDKSRHAIDRAETALTKRYELAQVLATLAVAESNLAVAAAIMERPQPDNGCI